MSNSPADPTSSETAPHQRLERMERFWDRSAHWNVLRAIYDTEAVRDPAHGAEAFDQAGVSDAARLAACIHPDMKVVDLGCGIGRVMKPLAPLCREIVGFDISEAMIQGSREYLAGIGNARVEKTAGSSLPTIEDASVGFLYSVLCFIHVDKRTAFRYFREIQRVLAPSGLALLQFENILSQKGLDEFERVVDLEHEYPLEFYSLPELEVVLRRAGLDVVSSDAYAQFLDVHVVKGTRAQWIEELRTRLEAKILRASGAFQSDPAVLTQDGELVAEIRSHLAEPRMFRARIGVASTRGEISMSEKRIPLSPGQTLSVAIRYRAAPREWQVLLDGQVVALTRSGVLDADLLLYCGLIPAGVRFDEHAFELFPNLAFSRHCRGAG